MVKAKKDKLRILKSKFLESVFDIRACKKNNGQETPDSDSRNQFSK